jgi:tRNA U54 and U55 pseudouridine synthase Pus10
VVWRKGKTLQNWGTYWELERNIVQTHWETGKHEKKILPPPENKKGKKAKSP